MATDPKVICLGLGRTGTASMRDALEMLGFGPCYHTSVNVAGGGEDFPKWFDIGDGNRTPKDFDALLRGYGSAMDFYVAMYPAEVYAAYPDAKYILTTRDPAEWEKSIKATILVTSETLSRLPHRSTLQDNILRWVQTYIEQEKYFHGRLYTHTQEELIAHNTRILQIIPPEKLLVYEVGEGWDKLVEFLDVPRPAEPFPHVNDTAQFLKARFLKDTGTVRVVHGT